jgi:hypothetical protein
MLHSPEFSRLSQEEVLMDYWIRGKRGLCGLLGAALLAVTITACGSSSNPNASSLLKQTFSGTHTVNSGNLLLSLTVTPSGSSTLTSPISIRFGGPFQSLGTGRLPKSNFNVTVSSGGKSGSLGILSTGRTGFVTLEGTSYQLPSATFQRLESSFSGLASSPGTSSGSGTLSKLGIHPLDWLSHPTVVGDESVAGTKTTHVRANVNVASLLGDLDTFLAKASSVGVSGASNLPTSLSPSTRQRIASEVQNPTFDVWTGTSDKTIRRLTIQLTLPVTGPLSTQLGGMRSAQIGLTMQYANLNQPQTISAPTSVRPFSEFTTKIRSFLTSVEGGVAGAVAPSAGATGTTTAPSATSSQRYLQCITNAHNDIGKIQQCASLINGQ